MDGKLLLEVRNYIADLKVANKEEAKKQRFISLLERFFDSKKSKTLIDQFTAGAEHTILNIDKKGKASDKGFADTQYQKVIIEFENDLKKTGEHAKEQLAEYLSGNWNTGNIYNFTLIASDCLTWKIYVPDIETISESEKLIAEDVHLLEKQTFIVDESNAEDFYYFLDAYLFKSDSKKPTLINIQRDFGQKSDVFINCFDLLYHHFQKIKESGEINIAYQQWSNFLSIAYDVFNASERIFIIHTYLSIFAKMLTYEIITQDDYIDDDELKGIVTGTIFNQFNLKNFTDNDFFHWVATEKNLASLRKVFRIISSQLNSYDFTLVEEDILKGVYQELVDRETRQSLGEYYTPDWLCESIVNNLKLNPESTILDPACGSGSFLRATIDKLSKQYPGLPADIIASNVYGIDIHPLSVLISKTTVILALGKKIQSCKNPLTLNVYLADTLSTHASSKNIDWVGGDLKIWIDGEEYTVNTSIFNEPENFDEAISVAEQLAIYTKDEKTLNEKEFEEALTNKMNTKISKYLINNFYRIYLGLKKTKESNRDGIWKFIILNLYKPCFFYRSFDYIVGNPPWFTYGSIQNTEYQNQLKSLAKEYNVLPDKISNFTHLEIAAIFLAHCIQWFLKENGKLIFVLPRSFFSAQHHDNTRSGKVNNLSISEIWDLINISPLFNVPSCVIFANRLKNNKKMNFPKNGLRGKSFKGKFESNNINLIDAKKSLLITDTKFYISQLGGSTAISNEKIKSSIGTNFYKALFKQGATILPRNFYFLDIKQEITDDLHDRLLAVGTSEEYRSSAKLPWKNIILNGKINSNFLFRTAISKHILPFLLYKPCLVLLPIHISKDKQIRLLSRSEIMGQGYIDTATWFKNTEKEWELNKTQRSKQMTYLDRLNYQNGITSQNISCRYIVLYTSSAKDANATLVDRNKIDFDFIVEHKAYCYFTDDEFEAYYLISFLNANMPNQLIKAFQSKGLFGPRDVHKKILDIPLPRYDLSDSSHMMLSKLGKKCTSKSTEYIKKQDLPDSLTTHQLGSVRTSIRKYLKSELIEIDKIIRNIIKVV